MNWKEKEIDWVENDRRVRVKLIGCTCSACFFSDRANDAFWNRDDDLEYFCRKKQIYVHRDKTPCDDFK